MTQLRVLITTDAERTPDGAAVPHAYATQVDDLRRAGIVVCLFGVDDRTSPAGIYRNIQELRAEILRFEPHLLVAYYGTMVAAITRLVAGMKPFVITFRGSDLLGTSNPGWKWRLRDAVGKLLSLWAAAGARRIVVNGTGLLTALPVFLRNKAHNLPNGINTEIFSPVPLPEARARLGWDTEEKIVLFNAGVGSGQVVKNRPLAEETIQLLRQRITAVRLEAISACSREEVALLMNASDALLVTSLHEGSPDLVKEALACNLPVVSVPCGDVPERLSGVSHSSVQPYHAGMLAAALETVCKAGGRSNGREQLFAQGLDIHSVTKQSLIIYHQAASS